MPISESDIGQVEIRNNGVTNLFSCAIWEETFAVMPAYAVDNISENQCTFI